MSTVVWVKGALIPLKDCNFYIVSNRWSRVETEALLQEVDYRMKNAFPAGWKRTIRIWLSEESGAVRAGEDVEGDKAHGKPPA